MGTSKSGPSLKNPEDFSLLTGSHSDLCICIRGPIHLSSYLSNIIFCHFPFPLLLLSYSALPRRTMPFKFLAISSPCNSLYFFSLESSYSSFKAQLKCYLLSVTLPKLPIIYCYSICKHFISSPIIVLIELYDSH